ncbi:MAG: heavy metal-responsive transcriptional regulator [bacterium]
MEPGTLGISELAALAAVTPDTLRYYERLGLMAPPPRTRSGYRRYDGSALERVALIRKAQAVGLTLREVREVLEIASGGRDPCEHVRALLARRLAEVDGRIADLQSLRRALAGILASTDTPPQASPCVCKIIESTEMRNAEFGTRNRRPRSRTAVRIPHSA